MQILVPPPLILQYRNAFLLTIIFLQMRFWLKPIDIDHFYLNYFEKEKKLILLNYYYKCNIIFM